MNTAHVHLMLNHVSIIGSLFGLVLLAVAMIRHSRELVTVSFACLASVAVISIPVYFTGRPAEEVIRHLPDFSEEAVERHEEAAQFAFTGIECVGVLALAALWLFRTESPPGWFLVILLASALLTAGAMIETADRGRQIRHPEIARLSGGPDLRRGGGKWPVPAPLRRRPPAAELAVVRARLRICEARP